MSTSITSNQLLRRPLARITHLKSTRSVSSSPILRKEIQDAYIIAAARTPVVPFNGAYVSVPASQLGAYAIKEAVSRSHLDPSRITAVYMGNVLAANSGQAPARQATILSGLSTAVEATTINKVCSSGLKAVALASQQIQLGLEDVVVAGGMENMSRVPYYVPRASQMPPFGNVNMVDGMIADGLWDFYNNIHMGNCAENTAKKHNISREAQDAYAIETYRRAGEAVKSGAFKDEIVPVTIKGKKGDTVVEADQGWDRVKLDKVPTLRPAFQKEGGTVTAANSSSFNDGASAVIVTSAAVAKEQASQSRVLARIVSTADAAVEPIDFPVAPAKAVPIALERAGLKVEDIAHWEINEAFAAVVVANTQLLGLKGDKALGKVNPLGGAIPLGHAIGSSGSRILTTMLHRLKPGEFGCAAICNGGGAASAMIVQRVDTV